jgi:hypothetical protein
MAELASNTKLDERQVSRSWSSVFSRHGSGQFTGTQAQAKRKKRVSTSPLDSFSTPVVYSAEFFRCAEPHGLIKTGMIRPRLQGFSTISDYNGQEAQSKRANQLIWTRPSLLFGSDDFSI